MSRLPAATGCGHRLKRNDHAGHSGNLKIDRGWLCGCGGFYALPAARLELTGRNRGVGDFWAGSSIVSDDFEGCWDIKRGGFASGSCLPYVPVGMFCAQFTPALRSCWNVLRSVHACLTFLLECFALDSRLLFAA